MGDNSFSNDRVSLNALRAFDAASRHRSFTRAARELSVTQAAVSHLVKGLEDRLGKRLFRRTPRGLILTDEGQALAPSVSEAFGLFDHVLSGFEDGRPAEVVTVGAVGTFAVGWLLPRLRRFRAKAPRCDIRLTTNNNNVDLAGEGLDFGIKFGDGGWSGVAADKIVRAPFSPLCAPETAYRLNQPSDLRLATLLRSYRLGDWPAWLACAGVEGVTARGPIFDSSWVMVQAAMQGDGIALAPPSMFEREIRAGRLVQPFRETVDVGSYWLIRLNSKPLAPGMRQLRDWLVEEASLALP